MSDKIITASLDEIVEAVIRVSHECNNPSYYQGLDLKLFDELINSTDEHISIRPSQIRTALEGLKKENAIPFEKAVDRASLNASDRIEFIKGAMWAKSFLTTPTEKGDSDENII